MQTSHIMIWKGKPNAIVHLSLSNSSPIPLFIVNLKPPPMEVVIGSGAMPEESSC